MPMLYIRKTNFQMFIPLSSIKFLIVLLKLFFFCIYLKMTYIHTYVNIYGILLQGIVIEYFERSNNNHNHKKEDLQ